MIHVEIHGMTISEGDLVRGFTAQLTRPEYGETPDYFSVRFIGPYVPSKWPRPGFHGARYPEAGFGVWGEDLFLPA